MLLHTRSSSGDKRLNRLPPSPHVSPAALSVNWKRVLQATAFSIRQFYKELVYGLGN